MQLYTILSPCNYIPYYPHANLYPIIPMQIYTLLSPWHDNPPLSQCSLYLLLSDIGRFHSVISLDEMYFQFLLEKKTKSFDI